MTNAQSLVRARLRLAAAGAGGLALLALATTVGSGHLPEDDRYRMLLQLMWSGSEQSIPVVGFLFLMLRVCGLLVGVLLLMAVLLPGRVLHRLLVEQRLHFLWSYSLVPAALYLSDTSLGRISANIRYAFGGVALWNPTPLLALIEAPTIERLQHRISPTFASLLGSTYSVGWLAAMILAAPLFVLTRDRVAADRAVLGPLLLAILALPLWVLFPVNDPWSVNPAYGYVTHVGTQVVYLFHGADRQLLSTIATTTRDVVGSCLPSMHVALPAYFALLSWQRRHEWLAVGYGATTVVVWFAVVALGRHWIVDGVAAIALAAGALLILRLVGGSVTLSQLTPERPAPPEGMEAYIERSQLPYAGAPTDRLDDCSNREASSL